MPWLEQREEGMGERHEEEDGDEGDTYTIIYYIILYYTILYYNMLYYNLLYYTII